MPLQVINAIKVIQTIAMHETHGILSITCGKTNNNVELATGTAPVATNSADATSTAQPVKKPTVGPNISVTQAYEAPVWVYFLLS